MPPPKAKTGIAAGAAAGVRAARGARAHARGSEAEAAACAALVTDGWQILGRRLRTAAGEVDVVAGCRGLLAFVEVKARPELRDAAAAVSPRQQRRLLAAAEILLGNHPEWAAAGFGEAGLRFDVVLVDAHGRVRRIIDAFRAELAAT